MYKACVFDLDGTLTDTLESLTYSVNETMKELGLPEIRNFFIKIFPFNLTNIAHIMWRPIPGSRRC